jgi:uncharacterized protein YggE
MRRGRFRKQVEDRVKIATMYVTQSIQRPSGVDAFGSCVIRVEPDFASIRFAVTRVASHPRDAFEQARVAARTVRDCVRQLGVPDGDVAAADTTLVEAFSQGAERKKIGYEAVVAFHVILRDLPRLEALLAGVVDAGADRIFSVHSKTSRLKEVRRQARERAVQSARTKAEDLARAAGAQLGHPLHIEDINADEFGRRSHLPDVDLAGHDDTASVAEAESPGSIAVAAAVMVCFALVPSR